MVTTVPFRLRRAGFTLVELLMVIVIAAILAPIVAVFIVKPFQAYLAVDRRAELTDAADSALRLMAREIRSALPVSVRVREEPAGNGTNNVIEFIHAVGAARYRTTGNAAQRLNIKANDTSFDLVGNGFGALATGGRRLVIYHQGGGGLLDAYADAGSSSVMTPAGTAITLGAGTAADEQNVSLNPGHRFPGGSDFHRVFMVDGPRTYACNGGALTRYTGYGYSVAMPAMATLAAGTADLTAGHVALNTDCHFTYAPGTATRSGLVTLQLTVTDAGESVTLLRQVRVDNVP